MSVYNEKIGLGKRGINFLRTIVDENKCYFNEIQQENDIGIDAIIELTENGRNIGKCIAVQVKTGASYFSNDVCHIPIENHYSYWNNYSLPVYGIVCDYDRHVAYWINISDYLHIHGSEISAGKLKSISFPMMDINRLDTDSFHSLFLPILQNKIPEVSYETAVNWTTSIHYSERRLAWRIMFRGYAEKISTWQHAIDMLESEQSPGILREIVYYLSYVSHNPDLWGSLPCSPESLEYAKKLLKHLNKEIICLLINLIDEDGIARGTIGQCIECIISFNEESKSILQSIIMDEESESEYAYYLLGYIHPSAALDLAFRNTELLQRIGIDSFFLQHFCEEGFIDFYS